MTTSNKPVFVTTYPRFRKGKWEQVRQHFRSYPSS